MDPTDPALATIGGHFGLLVAEHDHPPPGRYGFESARAALYSLLRTVGARRIHIPAYTCPDVGRACVAAGLEVVPYGLGPDFEPLLTGPFGDDEIVLVTDHFGLNGRRVEEAVKRFGRDQLVIDNAQAYFAPSRGAMAALYSPRKFIPAPDGGFLETALAVTTEHADEAASFQHLAALAARSGRPPEPSREMYLRAEARLDDISSRAMSQITSQLIRCSDQDSIRRARQANFDRLAAALGDRNALPVERGEQTPLVYPLIVRGAERLRHALHAARIFCPRFWPGLRATTAFEEQMLEQSIFLPIDHRHGPDDMDRIIHTIDEASEAS